MIVYPNTRPVSRPLTVMLIVASGWDMQLVPLNPYLAVIRM
jgi:hypothetical protein